MGLTARIWAVKLGGGYEGGEGGEGGGEGGEISPV